MEDDEILIIDQIINDVAEAEEDAEQPIRRRFEHIDPFEALSNTQFISLFRMNKDLARVIINMLQPYIVQTHGATAIDLQTKVLVALLFYAHGSYQKITGRNIFSSLSQAKAEEDAEQPIRRRFEHIDPFEALSNTQFISLFRMNKDLARVIINMLQPYIVQTHGATAIDLQTKVSY
ncbi:hypothetical protein FQR65_LT18234 [Abscondita terminalis]|nr:hypothetical protein FQR65_LT18234 [Abscondita terminalis]